MCRRFVDQIDGLVWQATITDVAIGKARSSRHCGIGDRHAVMQLVALLHAPQNLDAVVDRRLGDLHLLKATVQSWILLHCAAVILWRGCSNTTQIASGQSRLEQAACVGAGAVAVDHGVQFIDEQHHSSLWITHLLQHLSQALLELPAKFGASDQSTHIQSHKPQSLKRFRHFTGNDALGQQLGDGRLAHTGRSDQNRIVLTSPREHLDQAADLAITADDRIQEALRRGGSEVTGITIQRHGLWSIGQVKRRIINGIRRPLPDLNRLGRGLNRWNNRSGHC